MRGGWGIGGGFSSVQIIRGGGAGSCPSHPSNHAVVTLKLRRTKSARLVGGGVLGFRTQENGGWLEQLAVLIAQEARSILADLNQVRLPARACLWELLLLPPRGELLVKVDKPSLVLCV